ncbi:4-coumarate--CoA ligase-like 6 [Ixodes scapularis]|uniref:4-coumarate--CoA ligase-like 6 n=1 Tax=Ixodes scapularis TaxID=6945 RepID=UPI001C384B2D|nr:4-coumarate--CoA ligase-like 6 [Ixodes scapularis]
MMFDETETVGALFAVTQTVGFRMIMRVVCSGASCVIIPGGTSFDEMVDVVRKNKITTLFASTTSIHRLAAHIIESGIRLLNVRNVVVIALRVTEKAAETIFSAFCLKSFRSMYGTTELSNVISWMPRDTMEYKTIGFPAPDVQMMVVDIDTGKVLGPKEHGELWVKSPTNMRAYHNNPDATAEVITPEGWLRTGDIVYYDETGRFYVVERIKQFFHCMERLVAQSEIEAVLLSHEGVEEAAVIDVPHPEYSDVAKAFVILKQSYRGPGRTSTQELQQFVAGNGIS